MWLAVSQIGLHSSILLSYTLTQSPCTALTAGNLPAVRAVQGDYQWPMKMVKIPTCHEWAHNPLQLRQSQSIFRQTNHKTVMPANWSPCLIPHWHVTTTGLGLCSSLAQLQSGSPSVGWMNTVGLLCNIDTRGLLGNEHLISILGIT